MLKLLFLSLLTVLCLSTCRWGGGLCPGACTSPAPVSISGVITRPNDDGTMDVGISGNNFETGATVTINQVNCDDVDVQSPQYLECTLPSQDIPIVDIIITNPSGGSSGGGGGGSGGGGGAAAFHTLFVSSSRYSGNLNGLTGADTLCQTLAHAGSVTSSMTGTWRAILSDSTTNAKDRLTFVNGASIKNTAGQVLKASASDLWTGGLSFPVRYDQNGSDQAPGNFDNVHTGTLANGTKGGGSSYCLDWTSNDSIETDLSGALDSSTTWINGGSGDCGDHSHEKEHIYCINSNN